MEQNIHSDNDNSIVFPPFDLSTKRINFGNGSARVTTITYKIRYYPHHVTLLKSIVIQTSIFDPITPSNYHIHFIPHELIQTTDTTTVNNQIIQQNKFLEQTGLVPILNIHPNIMNTGLKKQIIAIPFVSGLEPAHLTEKSGKLLLLVNKSQKDNTRTAIDQIINDIIFPDSKIERPSRANRHNINTPLVTYAADLQKANTTSTIQFHNPSQNAVKRNI